MAEWWSDHSLSPCAAPDDYLLQHETEDPVTQASDGDDRHLYVLNGGIAGDDGYVRVVAEQQAAICVFNARSSKLTVCSTR